MRGWLAVFGRAVAIGAMVLALFTDRTVVLLLWAIAALCWCILWELEDQR